MKNDGIKGDLISRERLIAGISFLEKCARKKLPFFTKRYEWMVRSIELGERRNFKALITAVPAIDPVHAAGGCYCRECRFARRRKHLDDAVQCTQFAADEHGDPLFTYLNDFCSSGELGEPGDDE